MVQECPRCERLRSLTIQASASYHALLLELESAHIRGEYDRVFGLRREVDAAVMVRNAAIHELSRHEQTHLRAKVKERERELDGA